jgi:serine/threonine protein kinase
MPCAQVVAGMGYLHSLRIIHRDLKPGNVLCSRDLRNVRVADFGLSIQVRGTVHLGERPI